MYFLYLYSVYKGIPLWILSDFRSPKTENSDISELREPILIIFGLGEHENHTLSRGGVFVVFSPSAFGAKLKNWYFEILLKNIP